MDEIVLGKCGYRCDLCLAYRKNIEKKDQRKALSDGWHKIYGFKIGPGSINCDGCLSSGSQNLIDKNCPLRPCVEKKGIADCSYCEEFPCRKRTERSVKRENIEGNLGKKLTEYEYELFVKPYESEDRLKKILGDRSADKSI